MFASCVTVSNPVCFPAVIWGFNPRIRSWKTHSSEWARFHKAIGGIYLTKKWRTETLQPRSKFDNFKPRLKSGILEHLLGERFVVGGVMIGVFWKRESRLKPIQRHHFRLLTCQLLFCLPIYTLWLFFFWVREKWKGALKVDTRQWHRCQRIDPSNVPWMGMDERCRRQVWWASVFIRYGPRTSKDVNVHMLLPIPKIDQLAKTASFFFSLFRTGR
jgi:hypothetical protein